jgi:ABC-2 type transport system ATP-binding protein
MKSIVAVRNLKVYRSKDFSLELKALRLAPGEILGVTGPNGSGKTTLLECLTGLFTIAGGSILVGGKPLDPSLQSIKAKVGYIPDDDEWLLAGLSAQEYFELLTAVYTKAGIKTDMPSRVHRLSTTLQFSAFRQQLGSLSHGNKKKVQIIAGLMHAPPVVIVDELRNGLDPLAIIAAEQIIKEEAVRGAGIIAATHDLWWAERIANQVLFLKNGSVAANEPTTELIKRYGSLENFFLKTMKEASHGMATA